MIQHIKKFMWPHSSTPFSAAFACCVVASIYICIPPLSEEFYKDLKEG